SVHHIWCLLSSQEYQDLPDGAETTLTVESLLQQFQMIIAGAIRVNAIEKPSEKFPPSTWMEARL
ncbi:hypothetical protein DMR32_23905, partial [Klebsiella pneumoniae]